MAADVTVAPTLGHAVLMTQGGVGASPGYDAIDLRRMTQAASGGQEGAYEATGWKVREHTSGANMQVQIDANVGLARVNGESVTHQGPYVVSPHSAVITLDVTAAHSTNPRVDMVVLQVRDNTHDALGSNDARVRILAGTATSGATLDNLNGQQSLPVNTLRLADVLVPATDTTISNAQIRDRRPWARGASFTIIKADSSHGPGSPATWTSIAGIAASRIECSGAPLEIGASFQVSSSSTSILSLRVIDGVTSLGQRDVALTAALGLQSLGWILRILAPTAGSHVFEPQLNVTVTGPQVIAAALVPNTFWIREIVAPNAANT